MTRPETAIGTEDRDLRIGRRDAPEERAADRDGARATRAMGFGEIRADPAPDPLGGRSVPPSVLPKGPGTSLSTGTRRRMEGAFGRGFGDVRVHSGPAADRAAKAIDAEAFTHGNDIVFSRGIFQPDTPRGAALLGHELAHTLHPEPVPTLRRGPGFFKSVARFFGFEVAFEEGEISTYLADLRKAAEAGAGARGTTASKDGIEADFDGDNKARQVVREGLHKPESVEVRTLLIREMMDGFLSKDDQEQIFRILDDSPEFEALEIADRVGQTEMQERFDGKNRAKLLKLLGFLNDNQPHSVPPVPIDWSLSYQFNGSSETPLDGPVGLYVRSAEVEGNDRKTETLVGPPGLGLTDPAGTELRADVPHGRNEAGQIRLDTVPGIVEGGSVKPVTSNPRQETEPYDAVTEDHEGGEIALNIGYESFQIRVDKNDSITGDLDFLGEAVTELEATFGGTFSADIEIEGDASSLEKRLLRIIKLALGEEDSVEVEKRKTKSKAKSKFKQTEEGEQTFEFGANLEGEAEADVDLTTETEGTLNGKGDYSVGGTYDIDADIEAEIKSKGEVKEGGGSILKDLYDLSDPVRRRLLEKILRGRLGPLSGPASEITNDILNSLMEGGAKWKLELNSEGDLEVEGEIEADLRGKWDAAIDVRLKSETTGDVTIEGSGTIGGSGSGKSKTTVEGEGTTDTVGEEDAVKRGKKKTVETSDARGAEAARTDTRFKAQAKGTGDFEGEAKGTATTDVSGISVAVSLERTGTEKIVRGAKFLPAQPTVRLLRKRRLRADPFVRPPSDTQLERRGSP